MSDTLSASAAYCQFDDDHERQHGFRLPADPYWLAPPQGSIVPIWHRGGAPNYQPKPMICRHKQDPIRAWRRERRRDPDIDDDVVMVEQNPSISPVASLKSFESGKTLCPSRKVSYLDPSVCMST